MSLSKITALVLSLAALIAIVVAVFLGFRYYDARATEDARAEALGVSKAYAERMFGYNPENIDDHIERSRQVLTGSALAEYNRLVDDNKLAEGVREQGIVSEVTIQDAGVVTNSRDTAKVLIFMNQSVTRDDKELVRVDPSRLTYSLVREDGVWKVNAIDVITDDSFRSKIEQTDGAPEGGVKLTPTEAPPVSGSGSSEPAPAPAPGTSGSNAVPVPTP